MLIAFNFLFLGIYDLQIQFYLPVRYIIIPKRSKDVSLSRTKNYVLYVKRNIFFDATAALKIV